MLELNRFTTCCFSGYRPHKFSFPLKRNNENFIELENNITNAILDAYEKGYRNFLCGGAMGFDLVCGETVVLLKEKFPDIKLVMVLPYKNQPKRFPPDWRQRYDFVLSSADHIYYFTEKYKKTAFIARNAKMVAHSSMIITYYNGKPGGTENTIAIAQRDRLTIINLHNGSKKPYEKLSYYIGRRKEK